jgi:ethanolamine utilization cobalamin adenosyltransferase
MLKQDGGIRSITIGKDTLITPAAAEYLKMMDVSVSRSETAVYPGAAAPAETSSAEQPPPAGPMPPAGQAAGEPNFRGPGGEVLAAKPEELTHLWGNNLVYKDHPVIIWRGKLDSLTAMILEAQALGWEKDNREFVKDLEEILEFVRRLLPCEYKNIPVEDFCLLGLSAEELKARSHNPLKYYGCKHILIDYRMGPLCLRLNTLRTAVREAELAAAAAFKDPQGKPVREDIIRALNRLSSLFYIMIFKYLPKGFTPRHAGI